MTPKKSKEDDSYSKAIKKLFIQKYSSDDYNKLLKSYKDENLDIGAVNDNLISKIAENIIIAPEALQNLALKRSDTIIQTMITKHKIAPARLIQNEPKASDAIRDEWVGCEITVRN
ncbi:hypothetical protein [Sulfurospirillum diekertiae]|nr:hypothetical protein [Sulfurospirillum diekertiae]